MRNGRGLFITFEGGEGSGKTTLSEKLFKYLAHDKELFVVKTREPGGTDFGKRLRAILLEEKHTHVPPRAEFFLFSTDRAYHVETLIKPALEQDMIVLCDRFYDSSLAYQGAARLDVDMVEMEKICLYATGGLKPDLTFYLDLDPEDAFQRIQGEYDRIEEAGMEFHKRVREAYLHLSKKHKDRFVVLDAMLSPEEVLEQAKAKLEISLNKRHGYAR